MARRIDIELTSARPDGSWTWRAAGALKPRGVLDGKLLSDAAKAGDVLRVDAEFEIEGITIVAVLPPKEKRAEPERLEIIGPPRAPAPDVTTSLTRPHRDGDEGPRRPRSRGEGGENPDRPPRPARAEGSDRGAGGPRPSRSDRPRIDRGSRPGGPLTPGGARSGGPRSDTGSRPGSRPRSGASSDPSDDRGGPGGAAPDGAAAGEAVAPTGGGRGEGEQERDGASSGATTGADRRGRSGAGAAQRQGGSGGGGGPTGAAQRQGGSGGGGGGGPAGTAQRPGGSGDRRPGGAPSGGPRGASGPGGAEGGDRRAPGPARGQRSARGPAGSTAGSGSGPEHPKPRRLNPGNAHRSALLESLPPEHRPIAEQVVRGGIPAVRTAIHFEAEKAATEGRTAPNAEALLAIAEQLLPKVKAAEWRDRADAAAKLADDLPLRDLRSILEGASAARDDEARSLAATLRETLDRRLEALRRGWVDEIHGYLAESRVVRALRLSARPPDITAKLPSDLAAQLTDATGKAMNADTPSEQWAAMLEAVAASPVRRQVKPEGLPSDATEPLLQAARQQSGRVPALAPMLGISMPPPPGPIRPSPTPAR